MEISRKFPLKISRSWKFIGTSLAICDNISYHERQRDGIRHRGCQEAPQLDKERVVCHPHQHLQNPTDQTKTKTKQNNANQSKAKQTRPRDKRDGMINTHKMISTNPNDQLISNNTGEEVREPTDDQSSWPPKGYYSVCEKKTHTFTGMGIQQWYILRTETSFSATIAYLLQPLLYKNTCENTAVGGTTHQYNRLFTIPYLQEPLLVKTTWEIQQ